MDIQLLNHHDADFGGFGDGDDGLADDDGVFGGFGDADGGFADDDNNDYDNDDYDYDSYVDNFDETLK